MAEPIGAKGLRDVRDVGTFLHVSTLSARPCRRAGPIARGTGGDGVKTGGMTPLFISTLGGDSTHFIRRECTCIRFPPSRTLRTRVRGEQAAKVRAINDIRASTIVLVTRHLRAVVLITKDIAQYAILSNGDRRAR